MNGKQASAGGVVNGMGEVAESGHESGRSEWGGYR